MSPRRLACIFTSAPLLAGSWLARQGSTWRLALEAGPWELVPSMVNVESPALATEGGFAGAALVCQPVGLIPAFGPLLRATASAFRREGLPLELVLCGPPVSGLAWLGEHAPELVFLARPDGDVRLDSPDWWRDRAGHAAAGRLGLPTTEPEDLSEELATFLERRGW